MTGGNVSRFIGAKKSLLGVFFFDKTIDQYFSTEKYGASVTDCHIAVENIYHDLGKDDI